MPPKRPLKRTRQTKLNLSPASSATPRAAQKATTYTVSSDSDSRGVSPSSSRPAKRQRLAEETERGMKLGMPASQNKRGMFGSSDHEVIVVSDGSSDTSEDYGEVHVAPKKSGRRQAKPMIIEEDSEEEVRPTQKKGRAVKQASASTEVSSDEESEGEVVVIRRTDVKSRNKSAEDSGEQDEVPMGRKKTKTPRRRKASTPVTLSDDEAPRAKRKDRRKARRASTPEADDGANGEAAELKEELAFLQSSPLPERDRLRSTQSKPKSSREKALEALKKRRAVNSDPPSSAGRKKPVVVDSDTSSDLEVIPEEDKGDISDEDQSDEVEDDDYTMAAHDALYGDDEVEDFINDDDAPIGVPAEHALPLQFSSLRNAKPRDLFKYAIDWMVQKKINPAFSSEDEIYAMTFRKLDDEVNGLASSKYHSSVWTKDFTRAIRARPEIVINDIDPHTRAIMEPYCEACNRKSHPATYEVTFTGAPYHKETLEPLAANASDSDSDSSDISSTGSDADVDGERATYDAAGERIPPESKVFTLGSTCKANAQVAHTLYHWRFHLNNWVIDYLIRQGHCDAEKVVARDKWSVRKRQKYANKIVDEMEASGEIKKLHRMYREQVNFALELQNEFRKGWGRRG